MTVSAPQKSEPRTQGANRHADRSLAARLLPYLAWQIAAILVAELVLFSAGLGEEEIFKLDPDLGTRHLTNKRVTWRTEGFAQSYFDMEGMREPGLTVAKPPGTYRVALLGDSMVEGLQVPIEDTFGQILQAGMSADLKKPVQVLNFGTSGYSTAQEYLQLKKQVFKFEPDLVVMCYDSRDMFENWSPADEVITNVRPVALHLPGGDLVVHSYHVKRWMNSPRAYFMKSIEWLRQNSRIWGLIAAIDLDLSLHNPVYRAAMNIANKPKQALKDLREALTLRAASAPSFRIRFFEKTDPSAETTGAAAQKPLDSASLNSAAPNSVLARSPAVKAAASQVDGKKMYVELVDRTMASLVRTMRDECAARKARFAVAALPVRAALCPSAGMETSFYGIDYRGELDMVSRACAENGIPFIDCQRLAERLDENSQAGLFYSVHLKPDGHRFLADCLRGPLENIVRGGQVNR